MFVLNEHTTESRLEVYADRLAQGGHWSVMSDAGTPGISDPGAALVDACVARGIVIDAIPGPSSVTTALSLSGFFAQRFAFLGYLSRKPGDIRRELEPYIDSPYTLVLFESPHRIDKLMELLREMLGFRRVAICRELTKIHQQVWRCDLSSLPEIGEMPRLGEFTIVVEGRRKSRLSRQRNVVS